MRRLGFAVFVASGCGGDDVDLTGMYRVDTAVASAPCGSDEPVTMPPAYLKFAKAEVFGAEYFSMQECTDAAGADCDGGGLFGGNSFTEPIDGGWRGVLSASSSGGSSDPRCTLVFMESTAVLADAVLAVERTEYSEEVDNTEALCSSEQAEARNDAMPCVEHELIEATKL